MTFPDQPMIRIMFQKAKKSDKQESRFNVIVLYQSLPPFTVFSHFLLDVSLIGVVTFISLMEFVQMAKVHLHSWL